MYRFEVLKTRITSGGRGGGWGRRRGNGRHSHHSSDSLHPKTACGRESYHGFLHQSLTFFPDVDAR